MGGQNAKADLENYRNGYPGEEDDPSENENLRFYKGERKSIPDGDIIDEIHRNWKGKYGLLERHHGYIQWLFPIREHGMNMRSQKLQPHEAEAIKADDECRRRFVRSYELMLDFFGMKLVNETTGEIGRSDNYKERYRNLNTSSHNYLRITRILKSMGELGFEHLKRPFLEFFATEIFEKNELRNCKSSLCNYWVGTLKDDEERAAVEKKLDEYKAASGERDRDDDDDYFRGRGYGGGGSRSGYGGGYGGYGGARSLTGRRKTPVGHDKEQEVRGSSEDEDEDEEDERKTKRANGKEIGKKRKNAKEEEEDEDSEKESVNSESQEASASSSSSTQENSEASEKKEDDSEKEAPSSEGDSQLPHLE